MSLYAKIIQENLLVTATFSSPFKSDNPIKKIVIRPLQIKGKLHYQISQQKGNQILHENVGTNECLKLIETQFMTTYKQALICTAEMDYQILSNQKGKTTILEKPPSKKMQTLEHNKSKNYLLAEGSSIPFLIQLGIMNEKGKVFSQKMSKFKQINRFLEIVSDTLSAFLTGKTIRVIDFGCGKAYLTFALYYFLKDVKKLDVQMIGIDLKKDVIQFCQETAKDLHCEGLSFVHGNISEYDVKDSIDLVVALHACDTATDEALKQAVKWKSKAILAAPCCQNEVYKQISCDTLQGLLQHGILKERFSAIATDTARALALEASGYTTQVLEFIDPEETPKNILIKSVFGNTEAKREQARKQYAQLKQLLSISPSCDPLV